MAKKFIITTVIEIVISLFIAFIFAVADIPLNFFQVFAIVIASNLVLSNFKWQERLLNDE